MRRNSRTISASPPRNRRHTAVQELSTHLGKSILFRYEQQNERALHISEELCHGLPSELQVMLEYSTMSVIGSWQHLSGELSAS